MHFLCVGMGAVGGYIGGSLVHAGQEVTFLLRSSPDNPPCNDKLEIRHGEEKFTIQPRLLVGSAAEAISSENYSAIILAVKTYDVDQVISEISQVDCNLPPVICFENGIEAEEKLARVIGMENVIPATLTSAISRSNQRKITIEKLRGIGIAEGHELTSLLLALFNRAGLHARLYADAKRMKWSKLLTNLLCNASSAILSMTPAEIMAHPDLYQLEALQIREALNVMRALDLKVINLPGTPVKAFSILFRYFPWQIGRLIARRAIASGRGEKMPSLYLDLHLKMKKSEVLALNGAVSQYGAQLGIKTPVCSLLTKALLTLVQDPAQIDRYNHRPQELLKQLVLLRSSSIN